MTWLWMLLLGLCAGFVLGCIFAAIVIARIDDPMWDENDLGGRDENHIRRHG